jgi:hypothetical protein
MKKYKRYEEEILPNPIKGFTGKLTLVRKIENKKEFLELPNQSRGIVYNNNLYMTTNPDAYVMHDQLVSYLIKHNIIKRQAIYDSKRKDLLDVYLRIIKYHDNVILGDGLYITKDNKNLISNFIPTLKNLNIVLKKEVGYK